MIICQLLLMNNKHADKQLFTTVNRRVDNSIGLMHEVNHLVAYFWRLARVIINKK
jgi:hypothetical protein